MHHQHSSIQRILNITMAITMAGAVYIVLTVAFQTTRCQNDTATLQKSVGRKAYYILPDGSGLWIESHSGIHPQNICTDQPVLADR